MSRERVYLVNEADEVVGEKWRDELADEDCWRVVSIWVTDEVGNILLQQRSRTKKIGAGTWSAAAEGTIELGDEPLETAVREVEEELGLTISADDLKPTVKIHYKDPQFGSRIKYGYLLTMPHLEEAQFAIQKSEVEQIKWFAPEEFKKFVAKNPDTFVLNDQYQDLRFY